MNTTLEAMIEVRWVARGGQGAVTASNILASAGYLAGYHGVQAIPFYGAERRGATVSAFTRLSNTAIRARSLIYEPTVLIVCDPKLAKQLDTTLGVRSAKHIILNSRQNPEAISLDREVKIGTVDATSIAETLSLKVAGIPVYNTLMLGAFAKTTELISLEQVQTAIKNYFDPKIAQLNVEAAKIAYNQTYVGLSQASAKYLDSSITEEKLDINHLSELPATPISTPTKLAMGTLTGTWRDFRPVLNSNLCTGCMQCWLHCPDGVITMSSEESPIFDYDYCKGCGICVHECRPKAIILEKEV